MRLIHGSSNVLLVLLTNFFSDALDKLVSYHHNDLQKRSLGPLTILTSILSHLVLLDVLGQNSAVKLTWVLSSQFIWKFATLGFDYISYTWSNAVGLRVLSFSNTSVNLLLVLPS